MSNNKQSMNLYTEEQVREAMQQSRYAFTSDKGYDEIVKSLTPIELPSDEEINIISKNKSAWEYNHETNFKLGARWMKEQILNQNK